MNQHYRKNTVSSRLPFHRKTCQRKKKHTMVNIYVAELLAGPSWSRLLMRTPINTTVHIAWTICKPKMAFFNMATFTSTMLFTFGVETWGCSHYLVGCG